MVLFDTCFVIDALRKKEPAVAILRERYLRGEACVVAAATVSELWLGAFTSISEKEKQRTEEFLSVITIIPFEKECAKQAAQIEFDLSRNGLRLETEDIQIAATAITHGEILVTADAHFTRIEGLRVLKY